LIKAAALAEQARVSMLYGDDCSLARASRDASHCSVLLLLSSDQLVLLP
jgi:hypothetical protein